MPELPEVETFRRSLLPYLLERQIESTWSSGMRLREPVDTAALSRLGGRRVTALDRVGKYLILRTDSDRALLCHLGMSGCLLVKDDEALPHTHLRLRLVGAAQEVHFVDPRRFGLLLMCTAAQLAERLRLGPDPLSAAFTAAGLHAALRGSGRDLKALLLDQSIVAGLGNIYVAEALFHAGLRPTRRGGTVTRPMADRLHRAITEVIAAAVERRGTTLDDQGYRDAEGNFGDNQHHLRAYGRKGQPCLVCGAPMRHLVQAQRSSYYCPTCQR